MAKLAESVSLQIVDDKLLPLYCLRKSNSEINHCNNHDGASRFNNPSLYFKQNDFKQNDFKQNDFKQNDFHLSSLEKNCLKQSKPRQSPSLQRIFRWPSVKGDRI